MRILRVRLRNLNSLQGDHAVDLTTEPLLGAGLFAITGPTGAGKTTLLDAITLALYGKAARYGGESNPEHVMSRGCGECMAEVEFQVPSGVYRAQWERRRARNKPDGALRPPRRYIYDSNGTPLAEQIRGAEVLIEALLGLDYDRFLRSALLAQGEFARFLKATANERAELLESLTGTVIYSRLGELAYREAGRKEAQLKGQEDVLQQIPVLGDEDRQNLEATLQHADAARQGVARELQAAGMTAAKINSMEAARRMEKAALVDHARFAEERLRTSPDLERLRGHRLTLPYTDDLARLDVAEKALASARKQRAQASEVHIEATQALLRANQTLRASIAASLETQRQRITIAAGNADKEAKVVAEARGWLESHPQDAGLADRLADLVAAIGDLKTGRTSLADAWSGWRAVAAQVLPAEAGALPGSLAALTDTDLGPILDDLVLRSSRRKETLDAQAKEAARQLDLRRDHLTKAKLVASLEEHRHDLKEGEPCPLCGAVKHPYAMEGAPSPAISDLHAEVKSASRTLETLRDEAATLAGKIAELVRNRDGLVAGLRSHQERIKALQEWLEPFAAQVPDPGSEDTLRNGLQERERAYRRNLKAEAEATQRMAEADRTVQAATLQQADLEARLARVPTLPAGEILPGTTSASIPPVADAEQSYLDASKRVATTEVQARDRTLQEQSTKAEWEALKMPLATSVGGTEFATLDGLRAARLDPQTAKRIEEFEARLKAGEARVETTLGLARKDIQQLLAEEVPEGLAAEALKTQLTQLKADADRLLEDLITRRNQLKADDDNRQRHRKLQESLAADRSRLVVWIRLRELIGSVDGSKFRRYAQTISLKILTRHANRHLAKLSDRYRICLDEKEALNLQIEDLHQAGVQRPMASLSGGESFLASLALALGLSDIAGRTVRIDSLFIDEGFGSLDPETLEIAIAALESLRQDHKTVGIISHVGLLKERISTQIVVDKLPGGISRLRVVSDGTVE